MLDVKEAAAAKEADAKEADADKDKKPRKKGKTPKGLVRDCALQVDFGESRLTFGIIVIGAKPQKVKGHTVLAFTYPADLLSTRFKAGKTAPILSLAPKGKTGDHQPKAWNLVIGEKTAALVPFMAAPTEFFGFGKVVPPSADQTTTGTIEWTSAQSEAAQLKVSGIRITKKELQLELQLGDRKASVAVPLPATKK